jgi:hypothetical protein
VQLIKQMGLIWARLTRPISWTHWIDTRQNIAAAAQEYGMANTLLKLGFMFYRIETHIATQLVAHGLTRPIGAALERWSLDKSRGRDTALWRDIATSMAEHWSETVKSIGTALRGARAAFAGRVEARNVDRLMSGVQGLDRMLDKARTYQANGDHVRATLLYLFSIPKLALKVLGAVDGFQGAVLERPELRHEVRAQLREMGKSPAEIEVAVDKIFGEMKSKLRQARIDAAAKLGSMGATPTDRQVSEAADRLLRERLLADIADLGLAADDFEARTALLQRREAWQERVEHGLGGIVAKFMRNVEQASHSFGIPLALTNFANAIGTSINYMTLFTPAYRTVGWWGPKDKPSPWFSSERDKYQADARAAMASMIGGLLFLLTALGLANFVSAKKRTKEEYDKLTAEGHKVGTVEFPTGDGRFIPVSVTVGPLQPLAPWIAAGGAIHDRVQQREEAQNKLNAEAAQAGLQAGKIAPWGPADWLIVAAEAAWGALQANKAVGGITGSMTEMNIPNPQKAAAGQVSPYVTGLPGYQELARAGGVYMDRNIASFMDFLVPLPGSQARALNMLGDPVGTPDAIQRVIQTMTAGTYPFPVGGPGAAYQALFSSGFRPPAIEPNKGYAIGNEFRPMTDTELANYTQARGTLFAQALASMGPNPDHADVASAFKQANNDALEKVGVDLAGTKAATAKPPAATAQPQQQFQPGLPVRPSTSGYMGRPPAAGGGIAGASRGGIRGPSVRRPRSSGGTRGTRRTKGPSLRIGGPTRLAVSKGLHAPRRSSVRVR